MNLTTMLPELYAQLLWLVIAVPLILAIPAVHSKMRWPLHLAILPAILLVLLSLTLLPAEVKLDIPWLLFGTGFAIDNDIRWILGMSVIIWLVAASLISSAANKTSEKNINSFLLLTMAGNLGCILSSELVGFFTFSTLMGYGFYGLLIKGEKKSIHQAGRIYLVFFILADLALFEALLLAASTAENLHYAAVHQAITNSSFSNFYLWMALIGFSMKAGILPFHIWLSAIYQSAPLTRRFLLGRFLLGGIPIATALLGLIRWLPLGEDTFYLPGLITQVIGISAILYCAYKLLKNTRSAHIPELTTILFSGTGIGLLGMGLSNPDTWRDMGYLSYPFIASTGLLISITTLITARKQSTEIGSVTAENTENTLNTLIVNVFTSLQTAIDHNYTRLEKYIGRLWQMILQQFQNILHNKSTLIFENDWSLKITLFLIIGLVVSWLVS